MHHIALVIRNGEEQRWRDRVAAAGIRPTPVMDRGWPGPSTSASPAASLSELATDQPGLVFDPKVTDRVGITEGEAALAQAAMAG